MFWRKMLVYKAEKIASYVCFDILAKRWVEPDYIAVSVFAAIMCEYLSSWLNPQCLIACWYAGADSSMLYDRNVRDLTDISNDDVSIIKHARKSLFFNNEKPWIKKGNKNLFDITMGSYDGAEVRELVGLFILKHLGEKFGKENIGLYRDDGLAIVKNKTASLADKIRKDLHKIFERFVLKITAQANLDIVTFLDVTFDLKKRRKQTFSKAQ